MLNILRMMTIVAAAVLCTVACGKKSKPTEPTEPKPIATPVTLNSLVRSGAVTSDSGLVDVGLYAVPDFVDIDNDGDQDLFVGEWFGDIWYVENRGGAVGAMPAWHLVTKQFLDTTFDRSASPCFVDLDADDDYDLIIATRFTVGTGPGTFIYYENTGTPESPNMELRSTDYLGFDNDGCSKPSFVDIDGDDDLDMFFGYLEYFPYGHQGLVFFENTGTAQSAKFELVTTSYLPYAIPTGGTGQYLYPHFFDTDGDKDYDLIVGYLRQTEFYKNTGTVAAPVWQLAPVPVIGNLPSGLSRVHQFVDLNSDQYLDLCIGIGTGWASTPDSEVGVVEVLLGM